MITAVRNGRPTLAQTLASVGEQTWPDVEHVVVDGASTDGTVELLQSAGARVRWTSEPDGGLYEAMNRGLERVREPERYVIFLNADDTFHSADAIERVLSAAAGEDLIYGRLERFDEELDDRDVIGREVRGRAMLYGMRCHHQACFSRRSMFDRIGRFDTAYRIAADYDWMVRAFRGPAITRRFVPVVVASMRRGGLSDRRYLESVRERRRIVARHYSRPDRWRYAAYTVFGDYGRFWLQRGLARLGLLRFARGVKRMLGAGNAAGHGTAGA